MVMMLIFLLSNLAEEVHKVQEFIHSGKGPSINDVRILGGGRGSKKFGHIRTWGGGGVKEIRTSEFQYYLFEKKG